MTIPRDLELLVCTSLTQDHSLASPNPELGFKAKERETEHESRSRDQIRAPLPSLPTPAAPSQYSPNEPDNQVNSAPRPQQEQTRGGLNADQRPTALETTNMKTVSQASKRNKT